MNIKETNDYETMSQKAVDILIETIQHKRDAYICLATGSSPSRMYELFVHEVNTNHLDISQVTFVKLDEWYGVHPHASCTCSSYIKEHLLDKLHQQPKQYIEFKSDTDNVDDELLQVECALHEHPIDLMVLGLGMDGHLGLNEPNEHLTRTCHKALLHPKTKTHDMLKGYDVAYGMTLGMGAIFASKHVIMLVCGTNKEDAYKAFMSQDITTQVPASLLWLHPNCVSIIDDSQFH